MMKKIIRTITAKKAPMKQTVVMLALVLAIGITAGMIGCGGEKTPQEPFTLTELFKADLPGGLEENVFLVEVAPGGALPKHYHPGQEYAYLLEGSGVLYPEGKPPVTLKAGLSINDFSPSPPAKPAYAHSVTNTSKKDPQRWLVVLVTEKGQPLLIPVP